MKAGPARPDSEGDRREFRRVRLRAHGEQLAAIDALDTGKRGGPEPDAITMANFGMPIPDA